jgi:hypothetical protein
MTEISIATSGHFTKSALAGMAAAALVFWLAVGRVDMASLAWAREFMFRSPLLFVNGTKDDHHHAVAEIARSRGSGKRIVMIGTSMIREGIDPGVMASRLSRAGLIGGERQFVDLSIGGLQLLDALYLVYLTQPAAGDRFYLFVSPAAFSMNLDGGAENLLERRYFYDPSRFIAGFLPRYAPMAANAKEMRARPRRFSPGMFLRRYVRNTLRAFAGRELYRKDFPGYARHQLMQDRPREKIWGKVMQARIETNAKYFALNLQLLDALVSFVRERGAQVEILRAPMARDVLEEMYGDRWDVFFDSLARRYGALCCKDLDETAALVRDDFFDPVHPQASGREKWTRAFAAYLLGESPGSE